MFEIQLSTTYLDVIAGRREFYLSEGGMLLWIFYNFDAGQRRLTQDDVFFNNNRNAFVVSQATCHSSVQNKKFQLECIWAEPTATGVSSLNRKLVAFDEITLQQDKQRAYYFDFDSAKEEINKQERQRKLDRLSSLRERFETLWLSYWPEQKIEYKTWEEVKKEFSLEGVDLPRYFSGLPHPIITALYSAKYGKPIVWGFKTLIEVAHQIAGHTTYLHYFRRALKAYDRGDQLRSEDKSGVIVQTPATGNGGSGSPARRSVIAATR